MQSPESLPAGVKQDEKTLAMVAHLLGYFTSFIGPLIIYFVKSDSTFVRFHSLQAVYFQLMVLVAEAIALVLTFVLIGIPLLIAIPVGDLIYVIIACIKSFNGEWFEYWLAGQWARKSVGA
jgi:uncharacterized Tic20 family protein